MKKLVVASINDRMNENQKTKRKNFSASDGWFAGFKKRYKQKSFIGGF